MTLKLDLEPDGTNTFEVMTVATEILSETCDLACPNLADLVEFLVDRWPDQSTRPDA